MTNGEFGENDNSLQSILDSPFPVTVELPNGRRVIAYDPNAKTEEEIEQNVLKKYEAADPIVQVAIETAHQLGFTAKNLLNMALIRLGDDEERSSD